jgi:hypothetical protein
MRSYLFLVILAIVLEIFMLEMIIITTIFSASFLFFYAYITVCGNR